MERPKVMVMGPFPPLLPLEVQMKVSPAETPDPDQLHEDAGHATETILFGPVRLTVTETPLPEVALKLDGKSVPFDPS
jgi:hypothetical protein